MFIALMSPIRYISMFHTGVLLVFSPVVFSILFVISSFISSSVFVIEYVSRWQLIFSVSW